MDTRSGRENEEAKNTYERCLRRQTGILVMNKRNSLCKMCHTRMKQEEQKKEKSVCVPWPDAALDAPLGKLYLFKLVIDKPWGEPGDVSRVHVFAVLLAPSSL